MALDAVELIMTVEERFGVALPDDEAERCETVGNLIDLVMSKVRVSANPGLERQASAGCLSQSQFYGLRRWLVEEWGVKREHVRPAAELSRLIPSGDRSAAWKELQSKATGTWYSYWPTLTRPGWLTSLLFWIPLAAALTSCACVSHVAGLGVALRSLAWAVPAALVVGATLGCRLSREAKTEFPEPHRKIRDIVRLLVAAGNGQPRIEWTRPQARETVLAIVAELSGQRNVAERSEFGRDLVVD